MVLPNSKKILEKRELLVTNDILNVSAFYTHDRAFSSLKVLLLERLFDWLLTCAVIALLMVSLIISYIAQQYKQYSLKRLHLYLDYFW